jgi:mRNA interferase MazF
MKSGNKIAPRRGWVYMADLDPAHGTEPGKVRPVLVIQSDLLNAGHASTVVLPLTTRISPLSRVLRIHLKKGEAGLKVDSDVIVDQVRSIDNHRFSRALGAAPARCLKEVDERIAILLDLPGA